MLYVSSEEYFFEVVITLTGYARKYITKKATPIITEMTLAMPCQLLFIAKKRLGASRTAMKSIRKILKDCLKWL